MAELGAITFLMCIGAYFVAGLIFAVPFVVWGAQRIDPAAHDAGLGVRLLILPGSVALWPVLLTKWVVGGGRTS
ncbi:hypothetical protein [Pyruvatibacter sp.]|uniref:hypothetical protein n=1 Tax=Pyruvatibacter sp. TaxID=1981328 RepID=UPI0032651D9C